MTKITPEERAQLAVYKEAIQLVFDSGSWKSIDGTLYWVIPSEIADTVDKMVDDEYSGV